MSIQSAAYGQHDESEPPGPQEAETQHGVPYPSAPRTLSDVGLSPSFLLELLLKILHYSETATARQLAWRIGLMPRIVDELLEMAKDAHLTESTGHGDLLPASLRHRLTDQGRGRVQQALDRCRYAGPAPVTVAEYEEMVAAQCKERWRTSPQAVDEALNSLMLEERVAFLLGRALSSSRCAMIFGPSGNGKSHLLTAFADRLEGTVLVPHSMYAYGQIIKTFDPIVHTPVDEEAQKPPNGNGEEGEDPARRAPARDGRWVRIRRPALMVGGELAPEFLELGYDPLTHFYQAPIHLKAQCGVLVIDDFGRQKISPAELLNRFVLSLERGRDNLVLRTGEHVDVPFQVVLLFSTNLDPTMLADEAHLRRIPYKVHMPPPSRERFSEILRAVCDEGQVEYSDEGLSQAVEFLWNVTEGRLKGSLPRDVVSIIRDNADQDDIRPTLTVEAVDLACEQFLAGLSPRYANTVPSASALGTSPTRQPGVAGAGGAT